MWVDLFFISIIFFKWKRQYVPMIKIQAMQKFIQWKSILPLTLDFQAFFLDIVLVNSSVLIPEVGYAIILIYPLKMQMWLCCIHDLYLTFHWICQKWFSNSTYRPTSFILMAIWYSTVQMCYSSIWFFSFPKYFYYYNNHNIVNIFPALLTRINSVILWCIHFLL